MNADSAPRIANALLGSWLFASAFVWNHSPDQRTNLCVVGALSVALALGAIEYPKLQYVNSLLALWLLVSAWAGEVATLVTTWNNTFVAFAMFALSLVPTHPPRSTPKAS